MAEGLNRAVGAAVPFTWKGRQYALERFGFSDIGWLEEYMLKRKRQQIVKQATDLKDVLTPEEYRDLRDAKVREANAVTEVSNEEIGQLLSMGEVGDGAGGLREIRGIAFFLSSILNRRYPGEFTEADILDLVAEGQISEENLAEFVLSISRLQGVSGNSTGRAEADQPPAATNEGQTAQ